MIKYGLDRITELKFQAFYPVIEQRDEQWVDIVLRFDFTEDTELPEDLIDFTALVICTIDGRIVQIIPQDEGCDCEYQFTVSEKEQISAFICQPSIQETISNLCSPK